MKLNLNELRNIIRKIIIETNFISDPYTLSVTKDNTIKVKKKTDTSEAEFVVKYGFVKVDIHDFPEGNSIKATALGKEITAPLDKDLVKRTLDNGWDQDEIEMQLAGGKKIKFVKKKKK